MKLAVFFDLPDGGARYALYKILENLREGNSIDVYTFARGVTLTDFSQVANVHVYKLPWYTDRASHWGRVWGDLYALFVLPWVERRIAGDIDSGGYDHIVVSHTRFFQAPWVSRYLRTPVTFWCQEPTRAFFEKDLFPLSSLPPANRLYESLIRRAKRAVETKNAQYPRQIIANSAFSASQIKSAYGRKAIPILLGVDTEEFYKMQVTKKDEVLVVGADEPQKALHLAVDTVAKLSDKRFALHIVGPRSASYDSLLAYAKQAGVKVQVSQRVTPAKLRRLYNESRCTLATSVREPFGLSAVESMACGTPVVAVTEGGYRETVVHEVTGYLVPRDAGMLAAAIQNVGKIKESSCLAHVRAHFTWSRVAKDTLALLG